VKLSDLFRSLDVYRIFFFKSGCKITSNKTKELYVFNKIFYSEGVFFVFLKII